MASPAAVLDILLTANTTQANAALAKTQAELSATGKSAAVSSAAVKKSLLGVSAVAVGVGVALFKVGEEFDKSFDKIRTRTGETGKGLKGLEESFKNVVKSVPTDFDSAATAIAGLNQRLGLTGKPLEKLTKQVTQLALITGTDVQENVESITRLFGDWGIATADQTEKLDKLFRASEDSGIAVSELARDMTAFGSPLRQLGFDFEHAAAMFAEFEQNGVNTSKLMPGLSFALKAFSGGVEATTTQLKEWGVSMKDPQEALMQIMDMIKKAPSDLKANQIAFTVFGQRAGPDMAAAIREGHFAFDDLLNTMNNGRDTISKAERSTRDFSEQWTLFKNRVMVAVQPVATKFFELVSKGMKAIARIDFKGAIKSLEDFWKKATVAREIVETAFKLIGTVVKTAVSVIKAQIKFVSSILTGEWKEAWNAVKDTFRAGWEFIKGFLKALASPLAKIGQAIGNALADGFSAAWDAIVSVFVSGANAIVDVINAIIKVINVIPGVDIKPVGGVGTPSHTPHSNHPQDPPRNDQTNKQMLARGGKVSKPMAIVGEQAPAHPEYVLATNPAYRNRNLALWSQAGAAMGVPGFALGGILPTVQNALTGAQPITASSVVDKLPDANLPAPFGGLGPWIIDRTKEFIQDQVFDSGGIGGRVTQLKGDIGKLLADNSYVDAHTLSVTKYLDGLFGLTMTSGYRSPAYNASIGGAVGSFHTHGSTSNPGATDSVGPMSAMNNYIAFARAHVAGLQEAMVDNVGNGWNAHLAFFKEGGVIGRAIPANLQKFNHMWDPHWSPDYGGPTMPVDAIAELAEFFGMPGITMAQVAHGESGYRPGSAGVDPGGTKGYGLWAITSPFNNSWVAPFGGYEGMWNPIANAIVAAKAYAGRGLAPWYGTHYVTDTNAHWNGDFGPLKRHGVGQGGNGGNGGKPPKPNDPITPTGYAPPNIPISASGYSPKEVKTIMALAANAAAITGDIGHAQIMDAFSWSPGGTDLSEGERAGQQGLWRSLVWNRQAQAALLPKAIRLTKGQPKIQNPLLAMLAAVNDPLGGPGSILEALIGLDALTDGGVGADTSTLTALKLAEAQDWARRYQVSQAQYGAFAQGGVIGGMPAVTSSAGGANTVVGNADVQVYMLPDGNAHVRVNGQGFDTKVQSATRGYGRRVLPGARGR